MDEGGLLCRRRIDEVNGWRRFLRDAVITGLMLLVSKVTTLTTGPTARPHNYIDSTRRSTRRSLIRN